MSKAKPGHLDRLEAFVSEHQTIKGPKCGVCKLPLDVQAWISKKLTLGLQKSTIASSLQKEGYQIQDYTIGNHARKHISR